MNRVFGLDLLRALAVGGVLVSHLRHFLSPMTELFFGLRFFGSLGVELFFVLSGFLIGGILFDSFARDSSGGSLWDFWRRRWFRTLPNYFLFVGLNFALALALGVSTEGLWSYPLFLQNFTASPYAFFPESWSLAVEEWFYLLFPLLAFLGIRAGLAPERALVLAMLGIFLGGTGARIFAVVAYDPSWDFGVRKVTLLRLDSLMYGVFGAWMLRRHPETWQKLRRPGLVIAMVFLAISFARFALRGLDDSFFDRTLGFSMVSLGVLLCLPWLSAWRETRSPLGPWIERISLWSYSLYLVNLPIKKGMMHFLEDSLPGNPVLCVASALVWTAVCVTASALLYRYFEKPAMDLRDRF